MKRRMIRLCALLLAFSLLPVLDAAALSAPVAENQEISTFRGVSVGGTLVAVTPDDGPVRFTITTAPSKGTVELGENGAFVYTPNEKSRGRDYFGYRATDSAGQESREATVIIRLCRQKKNIRYADTAGLACDYAAHVLAEKGLFCGAELGGKRLFEPERTMTRGEFLSLCMSCAGTKLLTAVENTGYEDDEELSDWLKPYVATALFEGYGSESRRCEAREAITLREAAELINACFEIDDVSCGAEENQALRNLYACGVWVGPLSGGEDRELTRSEAAVLLLNAIKLRKK